MANVPQPRSELTFSAQGHVRARMIKTAALIARQLDDYIKNGQMVVAGREITLSAERIAAYRLILDRTVPTLTATEIKRTTALEGLSTEQLVSKLAELVRLRPELAERLQGALGGRVIQGEAREVGATEAAPGMPKPLQAAKADQSETRTS